MKKIFLHSCIGLMFISPVNPLYAQNLKDVSNSVLLNNPEVLSRWHAFLAAKGERDASFGGFLPRVDLTVGVGKEKKDDLQQQLDYNRNSTSVALSQMLYDGFSTSNDVKRLDHAILVRAFELRDSAENAALESVRAYYDVLRYRKLITLAEDNYVRHRTVFEQIQGKVQVGAGRRVDLEQVSGRLALAESNLLIETANLHDVSARFQRIVGQIPSKEMEEHPGLFNGIPKDAVTAIKTAQFNNPSLRAAIENVRSANYAVAVRRAQFQPRVDMRVRRDHGRELDGVAGRTGTSVAEVTLNWNLFNGLSDVSRSRQYIEQAEVAKGLRDKACRDIRQTMEIAFNDVQKYKEQLSYLDQHQLSIEKARDAYRQQFDIGQRTLLDLLDSENELYQAKRAYTNAGHDLLIASARAQASMGHLLSALGISADHQEKLPDFDKWESAEEAATQCPADPVMVHITDKESLKARAVELMKEIEVASPQTGQAVQTSSAEGKVREALDNWRMAWALRDLSAYFASYAPEFSAGGGVSYESWQDKRREVIGKAKEITLEVDDVKINFLGETNAETSFRQAYRSKNYQDVVYKKISWQKQGERWVIVSEINIPSLPK
ncbi:MAG: TolC family outer membrane protein [Gammaproteobacteria bacterium]|nr:TolC family outer membrane protein [Gammaproteobacteria bacterium]MBU1730847.1 TolC family outer membrane protein [Gammaproteobacteria bacterium]MBU1891393.1 TolC family outer membrane protein [Gammaproteobacteria bacterium]